ncbi:MAG TPA: hypothetical protein VGP93_14420 [Polyangiaceae bacterium]|jgi:UTP:GlnB (protein PII) uridylyltransferase|nr:hypothetical protein [Polyangiaceae bacterium]
MSEIALQPNPDPLDQEHDHDALDDSGVHLIGSRRLAGDAQDTVPLRAQNGARAETTIRFLEGEGGCSVLEVETSDSSGFIRGLSHALIEQSVEIVKAEVRRVSGGVQDRFVLTDHDGSPIGPAKRLALQVAVLSAVDSTSELSRTAKD